MRTTICDNCLTAACDEGADPEIQETICLTLGADIADHICEATEEPDTRCRCACH